MMSDIQVGQRVATVSGKLGNVTRFTTDDFGRRIAWVKVDGVAVEMWCPAADLGSPRCACGAPLATGEAHSCSLPVGQLARHDARATKRRLV